MPQVEAPKVGYSCILQLLWTGLHAYFITHTSETTALLFSVSSMFQFSENVRKGHKSNTNRQTKSKCAFNIRGRQIQDSSSELSDWWGKKKGMWEQHLLRCSQFDSPDLVMFPVLCSGMANFPKYVCCLSHYIQSNDYPDQSTKTFSLGSTREDVLRCLQLLSLPLKDSQKWLIGLLESAQILKYHWNKNSLNISM